MGRRIRVPAATGEDDAVTTEVRERDVTAGLDAGRFVRASPGPFAIADVAAPWGPVLVATTSNAVLGIAVLAPPDAFVADVERRTSRERARSGTRFLDDAADALAAFLAGEPALLLDLPLDPGDRSDWDRAVFGGVREIGWGSVASYGEVARRIGRPGAARATGGAVGRNPIGLAIPCHRVIAGDGSIGGYGGSWFGTREELREIKRELLAREGVVFPRSSARR
jgi:O-6-methylguanine DNA methyltransferase